MVAPVSLLSWVHNEEHHMEEWLSQLSPYVSEIILMDVESTDQTGEIAKKFTTKVYRRPFMLCGDQYRLELLLMASQPWILWSYPDERWPEKTLGALEKLSQQDRWTAYAFMRHEYMDRTRMAFGKEGKTIYHGTPESPNYQTRMFKRGTGLYWTELVHAEYHGKATVCPLPPEYFFEHQKTVSDQSFDNWRTYTWAKSLIWRYRDTSVEPYKRYIESYVTMVKDSELLNLTGQRSLHMSEEFWWEWWKYKDEPRISLEGFESRTGMPYGEFLAKHSLYPPVDALRV